ncbi:MAG: hypothetical protein VYE73_18440 [Acidobacteriota bacterium]|nr:hypothetical protein [Acidobacteriota bacterium]
MILRVITAAVFVSFVAAGAAPAQTFHQRDALIGHESFAIQIVGLGDGEMAQKLGIDGGALHGEVIRRATAAGVKVEDLADDGARAQLEIKVILAFHESVELAIWSTEAAVKQAFVDPNGRFLYAATWSSGGYVGAAVLARAREEIESSVYSQLEKFLADHQTSRRSGRENPE